MDQKRGGRKFSEEERKEYGIGKKGKVGGGKGKERKEKWEEERKELGIGKKTREGGGKGRGI